SDVSPQFAVGVRAQILATAKVAASGCRSGRSRLGPCGMATSRAACTGLKRSGSRSKYIREADRTPSRLPPMGAQGEIHGQDFALREPGLKLHSSGNIG